MRKEVAVTINTFSYLEIMGLIAGTVLCILQHFNLIDIGWFWAHFPLWIVFAVELTITIPIVIICAIAWHRM